MLLVLALDLNATLFPLILGGIVVAVLVIKFFGLWAMPEHWLNHIEPV